jgi:hypothetical protein
MQEREGSLSLPSSEVYGDYDGVMSKDAERVDHDERLCDVEVINEMQVPIRRRSTARSRSGRLFNTYGSGSITARTAWGFLFCYRRTSS